MKCVTENYSTSHYSFLTIHTEFVSVEDKVFTLLAFKHKTL